jgi:uncharacterized protein (DUF58 family)
MTDRGRRTLLLAGGIYFAAWIFGSTALYPVALGLALAVGLAVAWVRTSPLPERIRRDAGPRELTEGDDLRARIEVEFGSGLRPPDLQLVERVGRLGVQSTPLEYARGRAWGRYLLRHLPRGMYAWTETRVVVEDPFGLARAERPLEQSGALVVYPRLVELDQLFSESGSSSPGAAAGRLLVRRPAGMELHSVREHQEGESLRAVHWPSTAKRARLMVKDLEDAPRDDLVVVLDARAGTVVGESFDTQVRAAGSLLQVYARRGRRASLVITSTPQRMQRIRSHEGDWRVALELLAEAEPTGRADLTNALGREGALAAQTSDVIVVTARVDRALVEGLLRLAPGRRLTVVYVDAASFQPRAAAAASRREALLLRLQAAGVAVAVVRSGDDLAGVLGAQAYEAAHA